MTDDKAESNADFQEQSKTGETFDKPPQTFYHAAQ
jgi:hypothetical protein